MSVQPPLRFCTCFGGVLALAGAVMADDEASSATKTSFANDVLPVLSKLGCNQGTCHGAAGGKGGFKLSLRGFDPELDFAAIVRDEAGRRINLLRPEESLILRKPTLAVPHQGGRVLEPVSAGYRVLLEWLLQGAPGPRGGDPHVTELEISPPGRTMEPGEELVVDVLARFSDGSLREASAWARFETGDMMVATVDAAGRVQAQRPGQTAVSVAYQNRVAAIEITVPFPAPSSPRDYQSLPRANYIDERVIEQWRRLRLWPSPPADDATFLRRAYLDVTGTLPEPDVVRAFLADGDPAKRDKLIDRLLDSPEFVDMWTQKLSDVFRVSREWITEKGAWTFHRYLRDRIARNVAWDVVVRELVAGAGDSTHEGPPNFYLLQKVFNEAELWPLTAAETTAQTFLGVRIQCARCHNHPSDRWTQTDYYGWANFFGRVGTKVTPQGVAASGVIYDLPTGDIVHPRLGRALAPQPLDGRIMPAATTVESGPPASRRQSLARWITSPDNPYFAHATANRVWRHFMGVGLVEPVDDLRSSNPPSNAPLLDALARDLAEHDFDVKHLMRTILRSRTYQLSSVATDDNRADARFCSHSYLKRLTAEQLLDAIGQVTGQREKFPGLPAGLRAQQLPDTKVASTFLDTFGRPLRRVASCECERVQEPNLGQALELMNSPLLHDRVTADGGLVDRLVRSNAGDTAIVEEIYLRCLGRPPTSLESSAVLADLAGSRSASTDAAASRREFFEDLLWATVNSREFLFDH